MWRDIRSGWAGLGGGAKVLLTVLLALQVPVVGVVLNNIGCGFSLDRAQYEHLAQIRRVFDGNPIYVPMTFEFSAITYTPLYWWVCGWVWKVTGPGFFTPQLVSLLCSLTMFAFVARFLWAGTEKDLFLTVGGLACLALASLHTGFWMFSISNDAMHFAFTVAGFHLLRRTDARGAVAAAACLSLGALAKQTGLAYVAAGAAYVLVARPRRAGAYLATAVVVCGGVLAWLQLSSGGQFYDIVVKYNRGPFWDAGRLWSEVWSVQYLGQYVLLLFLSLWPLFSARSGAEAWRRLATPEYAMAAAGIVVSCIAQPKFGSGNNHAVIAIAGLIVCGFQGLRRMAGRPAETDGAAATRGLLVALQVAGLVALAWTPTRDRWIDRYDRNKYEQIAEVFRKGHTIMYHYPYLTGSFGYPEGGHHGSEMCRWIDGRWSYANKPDFLSAPYREQRFDYVILGASVVDQDDPTIQAILDNYGVVATLPPHPTRPNTMMLRYPVFVLKAKRLGAR